MIGAGTVINPIVKIVTAVAIIAAVSIFVIKPVLETTERVSDDVGRNVDKAFSDAGASSRAGELSSARSSAIGHAQGLQAGSQPWTAAAHQLTRCVRQAKDSLPAMRACARFGDNAQDAQFDRNFALPYADSLEQQGKTADASKVRACVEKAGFKPGPMSRCRDLANKLLFG